MSETTMTSPPSLQDKRIASVYRGDGIEVGMSAGQALNLMWNAVSLPDDTMYVRLEDGTYATAVLTMNLEPISRNALEAMIGEIPVDVTTEAVQLVPETVQVAILPEDAALRCPHCDEPPTGTLEALLGSASLNVDEDTQALEYGGDTDVNWDSQEPVRTASGLLVFTCYSGHHFAHPRSRTIGDGAV